MKTISREPDSKWAMLEKHLTSIIGKKPRDLNAVLFIIGTQELGQGNRSFSKEEKQDLMHIAICKVLSLSGYYTLEAPVISRPCWLRTGCVGSVGRMT